MHSSSDVRKKMEWADSEKEAWVILRDAVDNGFQLCQSLSSLPDHESIGYGNWPLLHICVNKHYLEIAAYLLENNVDVNEKNLWGTTALYRAAQLGNEQMVRLLIDKDAILNHTDREGESPLHVAATYGHASICKILIEANTNLNVSDCNGITALYAAASTNRVEIVRMLLHYKADPDKSSPDGITPVHIAAALGFNDCVSYLIESCADLNFRSIDGITPLIAAVRGNYDAVVKTLLSGSKLNLDIRDNRGRTALYIAVSQSNYDIVAMLLDAGSNPNIAGNDRATPLYISWRNGKKDIYNLLTDFNANLVIPTITYAVTITFVIAIFVPFSIRVVVLSSAILIYLILMKYDSMQILNERPVQKRRSTESAASWRQLPIPTNSPELSPKNEFV